MQETEIIQINQELSVTTRSQTKERIGTATEDHINKQTLLLVVINNRTGLPVVPNIQVRLVNTQGLVSSRRGDMVSQVGAINGNDHRGDLGHLVGEKHGITPHTVTPTLPTMARRMKA